MPIYAFECAACGHQFDRLQKIADPDPTECPTCGADQIRRQITAPAFRLAGSGWYETDFKKDGDKKRNLSEKSEGGQAEVSSGAKADPGKSETSAASAGASKAEPKPAAAPVAAKAAESKPNG